MMARDYLAIMGSSAPVKRLFSQAKLLITPKWTRLNDQSIDMILAIKSWDTILDQNWDNQEELLDSDIDRFSDANLDDIDTLEA